MRFSNEQDRILFAFSSTDKVEYRVWLTRRFVRLMWKALMKIIAVQPDMGAGFEPHVREAILGVKHQESVQALNVSQPHDAKRENKKLTKEPILVTGCTSRVEKDGTLLSLELIMKDGSNVAFYLNEEIFHSLFHLLIQSTTQAEWNLNLQVGDPQVTIPKGGRPLH